MIWHSDRLDRFADDCFSGMCLVFPERWQKGYIQKNSGVIMRKTLSAGSFAVIVSGGAGNGPLFHGYVGDGLADAAVVGGPYSAPNAYAIYEAGKTLGKDRGVLLFYNNFAGDYLNNDMAEELLAMDGIKTESVVCTDDIASAIGEKRENRSGRAGAAILIKLAAAYSKKRFELKKAAELLRKANTRLATLSVHVDENQSHIFYGAGFSGEPPILTENHMNIKLVAKKTVEMLTEDVRPQKNEEIFLMINRLRLASYSDAYIMAKHLYDVLSEKYDVSCIRTGAFSNIADVYGFDVSIFCMNRENSALMKDKIYTDAFVL